MVDQLPEFESADKKGSSNVYTGTVGTSWTAVPAASGNKIQEIKVVCDWDQTFTNYLEVSLDGGTTTKERMYPGGFTSDVIKGTLTQIHLKGNVASVKYTVTLNKEDN